MFDGEAHYGGLHVDGGDRFQGIDYTIVDTDHGSMLGIEIDAISDGYGSLWVYSTSDPDQTVETKDPQASEPILMPHDLVPVANGDDIGDDRRTNHRGYDATSKAYIDLDSDAKFDVIGSFRGVDEWWTSCLDWNEYETVVSASDATSDSEGE